MPPLQVAAWEDSLLNVMYMCTEEVILNAVAGLNENNMYP